VKRAAIRGIEVYFPENILTNENLASEYEGWNAVKIEQKTGIQIRHIANETECASDMATAAAIKLFESGCISPEEVDFILLCTQSPDYFLPTTACLIQDRLGLRTNCGALDFNLGCSGFVYGLGLAKGLIETDQARNVLLITAETYSKHIHPGDKSVRTLFGDAAAATLITACDSERDLIGPFVYGTDGSGATNLIVPTGGMRKAQVPNAQIGTDDSGNRRTENNLYMNGAEIFTFTLRTIPPLVTRLLHKATLEQKDVDMWVFHQANQFMLDHLRKKMNIPPDRFVLALSQCGNTVSSTIPIALHQLESEHKLHAGNIVALVGFGVGYSWGAALLRWQSLDARRTS
jgi:3-oxoacyl-[acyl-carrier-protein] synthase-3